ncbi:MAG: hypothetical protein ACJAT1_001025 [Marivirga sp.]|jgi:hypothetical protein
MSEEKTVLLGLMNGVGNSRVLRISSVIMGFFLIGISILNSYEKSNINLISIINLLTGTFSIISGTILSNKDSKYALKIVHNSQMLSIKNSLFRKPYLFNWGNIDYIQLSSFQITVHIATKSHTFHYKHSKKGENKVKALIRASAAESNISVFEA